MKNFKTRSKKVRNNKTKNFEIKNCKIIIATVGLALLLYGYLGINIGSLGVRVNAEDVLTTEVTTTEGNAESVTTEENVETAATEELNTVPTTKEGVVEQLNAFSNVNMCVQSSFEVLLSWERVPCALSYEIYRKQNDEKEYTLVDSSDEPSFLDDIDVDEIYHYKIVPVAYWGSQRLTGIGATKTLYNQKIVSTNHQKYSYSEMEKDIKQLCDKYYGLVRYEVIGTTADNRKLYDVILGSESAEKSMLVISNVHAREYMTVPLTMAQIERYLDAYNGKIGGKSVKQTLDQIAIHIVPMANPDGTTLSQYGRKKIKSAKLRKFLKKYNSWSYLTWKANANGVDLNSNFSYRYIKKGRKGPAGYSGKKAISEPESKAIAKLTTDLIANHQLKGVVNYHAMGSIIFGDSEKKNVRNQTTKMYKLAIKETGYVSAAGYSGSGHGNYREYVMYKCKVPSITIEIGRRPCPLPQSEFRSIWKANKDVVMKEAQLCAGW